MRVLLTGAAGFIGYHTAKSLLARGDEVVGVDNLNTYYEPALKRARLERLRANKNFSFEAIDVADRNAMAVMSTKNFTHMVHLAAQAGVRHSLIDPYTYIQTNVMGQTVMLELARKMTNLVHFVYASSSSVYGANTKMPFSENDAVDRPVSIYAATKRADELIAYTYAHLYSLPVTGLRFFTVYGPWGRPDMAAYIFTKNIINRTPIRVFNHGQMRRDFTYIDDVIPGILAAMSHPPVRQEGSCSPAIYNLGNSRSEKLLDFIAVLEKTIGKKAVMEFASLPPGDVLETFADIGNSRRDLGFDPKTQIEEGLPNFVAWYHEYYKV